MPRKFQSPFQNVGQIVWLYGVSFLLVGTLGDALAAKAISPQQQQSSVKLMTYNIHAWRDSDHQCNFDRVIQVINQVKPVILCLNEVLHPFAAPSRTCSTPQQESLAEEYYRRVERGDGRNSLIDKSFIPEMEKETFLHKLAKATNLENIDFLGATDNSFFGKGSFFGNAILTRYPIEDCLSVPLDAEDGDIKLGNQKRDFVDARAFSAAIFGPWRRRREGRQTKTHGSHLYPLGP